MSILHTVNKSPFDKNSLVSCLKYVKKGSAVLLIEDGVYGALKNTEVATKIASVLEDIDVYALTPDLATRGVSVEHLIDGVKCIDYAGFVDLVTQHDKVNAWL